MKLIWDLETDGLLEEVTRVHCMAVLDVDTNKVYTFTNEQMPEGLRLLEQADVLISHNGLRFDHPVLEKLYGWKYKGLIRDTLVIAKLIWPNLKRLDKGSEKITGKLVGSHSLKAWGLRLGVLKGEYGETADWKVFTPEMLEYCVQDVVGPTLALWKLILKKDYSEEAIQTEHDFTFVAHQIELHGFRLNEAAAKKLHVQLVKRRLELEAQLQEKYKGWWTEMKTPEYWEAEWQDKGVRKATKSEADAALWEWVKPMGAKRKEFTFRAGPMAKKYTPFSASSRHHIIRVLMEDHGWKPEKFTDGGDPALGEEILETLDIPEAKLLIEYLMLDKRIGQLAEGDSAWLKVVKSTGYIHGRIDSMGAVTSRCGHSGPNMAQVPSVDSVYGPEMRALFLPDPGHVLVGADASGIQLRVIAHYASRWDGGKYADLITKGDIHTANQQAAGLPTRGHAKTFIYAWLLGAGDPKIGAITGKGAKEGKELKARFLAGFPALKALKEELNTVSRANGFIRGLDGRQLPCENGHAAMGSLLQGFEAVVMKKAAWFLYSDLTGRGWVHGKDWGLCAFVHDEFQISARKDIADEIGKAAVNAIVKAGEYFRSRCPLAGEYKVGTNWASTH